MPKLLTPVETAAPERKRVGKLLAKKEPAASTTREVDSEDEGKPSVVVEAKVPKTTIEKANIYAIAGIKIGKNKDKQNTIEFIDPTQFYVWDQSEMLAVASEVFGVDLSKHNGEPREMQRKLISIARKSGVKNIPDTPPTIDEAVAEQQPKGRGRPKAEKAVMPLDVPVGKDGLPTQSPVVGRVDHDYDVAHVDRDDWDIEGKMTRLHEEAEKFRRARVEANQWDCGGINCHDCIEHTRNMERPIDQCLPHSLKVAKKEGTKFNYKEPKDLDKLNAAEKKKKGK